MLKIDSMGEADTIEKAVLKALEELKANENEVNIEIIQEPKRAFLKSKNAIVKLELKNEVALLREREYLEKEEKRIEQEKTERAEKEKKIREEELIILNNIKKYSETFSHFNYVAFLFIRSTIIKLNENGNNIQIEDTCEDIVDVMKSLKRCSSGISDDYKNTFISLYKKIFRKYISLNKYASFLQGYNEMFDEVVENNWRCFKMHMGNYVEHILIKYSNCIELDEDLQNMLDNRNEVINECNFNIIYFTRYINCIYAFCTMNTAYNNSLVVRDNEEFCKMVMNTSIGEIKLSEYDRLYKIYNQYYANMFSSNLTEDEFRLAVNLQILAEKTNEYNMQVITATFDLLEISIKEIVDYYFRDKLEFESFYHYFLRVYLESGKLDIIMESDKHGYLISSLVYSMNCLLIDKLTLEQLVFTIFESHSIIQIEDIYHSKYSLLNKSVEKIESIKMIKESLASAKTGEDFELVLKQIYETMGYVVSLTKKSGDQGADLIVEKSGDKGIIQAKFYSAPVGNKAVQEVVAALKHYNASKGYVITNNCFTTAAKQLALSNNIQLIDGIMLNTVIDMLI